MVREAVVRVIHAVSIFIKRYSKIRHLLEQRFKFFLTELRRRQEELRQFEENIIRRQEMAMRFGRESAERRGDYRNVQRWLAQYFLCLIAISNVYKGL